MSSRTFFRVLAYGLIAVSVWFVVDVLFFRDFSDDWPALASREARRDVHAMTPEQQALVRSKLMPAPRRGPDYLTFSYINDREARWLIAEGLRELASGDARRSRRLLHIGLIYGLFDSERSKTMALGNHGLADAMERVCMEDRASCRSFPWIDYRHRYAIAALAGAPEPAYPTPAAMDVYAALDIFSTAARALRLGLERPYREDAHARCVRWSRAAHEASLLLPDRFPKPVGDERECPAP